jgi:hypothetical protein
MYTWAEYFITLGFLLLLYCLVRILFCWSLDSYERPPGFTPSDWNGKSEPCKPIDASPLAARISCVRQGSQAELQPKTMIFKRALRVRDKREEIAQKAFFSKSTRVEETEEGQSESLLTV